MEHLLAFVYFLVMSFFSNSYQNSESYGYTYHNMSNYVTEVRRQRTYRMGRSGKRGRIVRGR